MKTSITTVRILATSAGNEFMLDIARIIEAGFAGGPVACEVAVDCPPSEARPGEAQVIVAPHEFFPLFLDPELGPEQARRLLPEVYVVNVEQPGSSWFEVSWEVCRHTRGVFDISHAGVREFRRRGVPARQVRLGYAPYMESQRRDGAEDAQSWCVGRQIDVLFMGHNSARREEFLARHADFFSAFNCRLVLADVARPRRTGTPGYYAGADRSELLRSSKILINVHASSLTYFESHRALWALANGCLLVTETSPYTEPLVDGRHFAMAPLDSIPDVCRGYLDDPERLRAVARGGYELVTEQLTARRTARELVAGLEALESAASLGRASGNGNKRVDESDARRQVISRLKSSRTRRAAGAQPFVVEHNHAYLQCPAPSVAVLISLYNYGRFIEPCLESVRSSDRLSAIYPEIVVIDDHSTDDSVARVQRLMAASELPMTLVRKDSNTGLADTRNVGVELARAPYVFVLDADNLLYPSCIGALHAEVKSGSVAAAYGLIRRFDDETDEALGLLSTYDWSVEEIVRRPYIDAMAMFDRRALLSVGGYSTELIEHGWFGWEDYDLWLKLAQAGYSCRLVPRVLSSYRVHAAQMINRTNRNVDGLAAYFAHKFQDLVAKYPDLDAHFGMPTGRSPAATPSDRQLTALRQHCSNLEHELAALHASTSWRITAPLRLAYRLLTGRD